MQNLKTQNGEKGSDVCLILAVPAFIGSIEVFYLLTDAQYSCFKRILKFTLKQLLRVSVQSQPSGILLFELLKL
jgi:hypothetical protein